MCRDRPAVRQREIFDVDRLPVWQRGDEALGLDGLGIEIVNANIEHAVLTAQLEKFPAGHIRRDVRTGKTVDLEVTVVEENDPLSRVSDDNALLEVVQRGTDKCIPAQLRPLDPAQRR